MESHLPWQWPGKRLILCLRRDRDGQRPGLRVHVRPLSRGREGDGSSFPSLVPIWEIRSQHQLIAYPPPPVSDLH